MLVTTGPNSTAPRLQALGLSGHENKGIGSGMTSRYLLRVLQKASWLD